MDEDSKLVQRFKSKDFTAFDEIFSRFYKPIFYYIYKMTYNTDIAEDITQDTFVKVYKALSNMDDSLKLSAWIYRIAHNACVDYLRKNKVSFELIDNIKEACSEVNEPEQGFINKELQLRIIKVMKRINSRYRSVLVMRDYNNLSYNEIACILKCSESAVKSLIHRARQEFQKVFAEVD
ncbi:MAG: RNA polymerase sigma factor [Bacillota bacterium]